MQAPLFLSVLFAASLAAQSLHPVLGFSSQFGSKGNDPIQSIALDAAGNIYIAGSTAAEIPLLNPIKPALGSGNCAAETPHQFVPCEDVFVAKFDPTGTRLLYSTYLGTSGRDIAAGLAVDRDGNAYVAGTAWDAAFYIFKNPQAFLYKLNPSGSAVVYSRFFGADTEASGVAVDGNGNAFVAGVTSGTGFQPVNALQSAVPNKLLFATRDGGLTWRVLDGFPRATAYSLAIDPSRPSTLYAATSAGLYKSSDSGATWAQIFPEAKAALQIAIDPRTPSTLYVTYGDPSYIWPYAFGKSLDGGATWQALRDALPSTNLKLNAFAIDPSNPGTLWMQNPSVVPAIFHSTDGGLHWEDVRALPSPYTAPDIGFDSGWEGSGIVVDPNNSARVYVCCAHRYNFTPVSPIVRTEDGGKTWRQGDTAAGITPPVIDPLDSSLYAISGSSPVLALGGNALVRSVDQGQTWTPVDAPGTWFNTLAIDRAGGLHLTTAGTYFHRAPDGTWTSRPAPWASATYRMAVDPVDPSTVYVALQNLKLDHAFVTKLDAAGSVTWATLVTGSGGDQPNAIALDTVGNAYLAGTTVSPDFPFANPLQEDAAPLGANLRFVSKIAADGSRLLYSTYLGGGFNEAVYAVAVDKPGNAYVAGMTNQPDYQGPFVARLDPSGRSLAWTTGLPGNEWGPFALALDASGHTWLSGFTTNPDFPLIAPLQPTLTGNTPFLVRFGENGAVDFSTYVGGSFAAVSSLAATPGGSVWLAGKADFNLLPGGSGGLFARVDLQPLDTPQPGVPLVRAVYNSAGYLLGDMVSPGEIVTLFGAELAPAAEAAGGFPLPQTLEGAAVTVAGVAAPLLYVSAGQINLQIPYDVPAGDAKLIVTRGTGSSVERSLRVVAATPGIYMLGADARSLPAVVHSADYSLVTQDNPAHSGEYLVIFCTGLGATNPPFAAGAAASGLAFTQTSVSVLPFLPGRGVTYAGLAPGFAGLYQVNFRLADHESPGEMPLSLMVAGQFSNMVRIYVK